MEEDNENLCWMLYQGTIPYSQSEAKELLLNTYGAANENVTIKVIQLHTTSLYNDNVFCSEQKEMVIISIWLSSDEL